MTTEGENYEVNRVERYFENHCDPWNPVIRADKESWWRVDVLYTGREEWEPVIVYDKEREARKTAIAEMKKKRVQGVVVTPMKLTWCEKCKEYHPE